MQFFVTDVRDGGININSKRWCFWKETDRETNKENKPPKTEKTQKVGRDSKHEIYWNTKKLRRNADTRLKWTSARSDVKILPQYCPVSSPNTQHLMFSQKKERPGHNEHHAVSVPWSSPSSFSPSSVSKDNEMTHEISSWDCRDSC